MKVYVSSTFEDLKEHRMLVYSQLRKLKMDAVAMEDYVASEQRPVAKCVEDVANCDVYVGIFAWRYGYIPTEHNPGSKSITELEYLAAEQHSKKRLIFLLADNANWQPGLLDSHTGDGDQGRQIQRFRNELQSRHAVSFFRSPDELAREVSAALYNLRIGPLSEVRDRDADGREDDRSIQVSDPADTMADRESSGKIYSKIWFSSAVKVARSVGLITDETGRGLGTGFLVRGASLHERFGDDLYLLTPSYIISSHRTQGSVALSVDDARLRLTGFKKRTETVEFANIAWSSPLDELDVSLVELKEQPKGVQGLRLSTGLPSLQSGPPHPEVTLVGHPGGRELGFSLGGRLLDYNEVAIQYSAQSEPGSGGSPVLDENLDVIGMHRLKGKMPRLGMSGEWMASEAVSMQAIRKALKTEFG